VAELIVVTDLREPLIVVHRRMMRARLVLMAVWIAGWIVAGVLYRHGWLATGILLATGPGVWVAYAALASRRRPGRRLPVTMPPPRDGARRRLTRAALPAAGDR
jgi:hypothetical protein